MPAIEPAGKVSLIDTEPPKPIAIVGVHGISPIQQYAFQDQLATGMLSYLNAQEERLQTIRGLLDFDIDEHESVPIEEVEPVEAIWKRF